MVLQEEEMAAGAGKEQISKPDRFSGGGTGANRISQPEMEDLGLIGTAVSASESVCSDVDILVNPPPHPHPIPIYNPVTFPLWVPEPLHNHMPPHSFVTPTTRTVLADAKHGHRSEIPLFGRRGAGQTTGKMTLMHSIS